MTGTRTSPPARTLSLRRLSALALVLVAAACSDDSVTTPDGAIGDGSVQVSGALSLSFSGPAASATDALTDMPTFGVQITEASGGPNTFDLVFLEGRPSTGTYTIGNPDTAVYGELGSGGLWVSVFGEARITESSATRFAGTATFTALRLGSTAAVTVNATFDARCFPVPGLFTCD